MGYSKTQPRCVCRHTVGNEDTDKQYGHNMDNPEGFRNCRVRGCGCPNYRYQRKVGVGQRRRLGPDSAPD